MAAAEEWHTKTVDETLDALDVRQDRGLNDDEVKTRRREYGANRLQEAQVRPWWRIFLSQFNSIVVYLLVAADILAFAANRWPGFVSRW